jgi:hypothetical protein
MSSYQDWDRFTNEMGISLYAEARVCCGTTKAGAPCKNSIKIINTFISSDINLLHLIPLLRLANSPLVFQV